MYKEEAYQDPSIRIIQPKDLPAEIQNQYRFGYSYYHLTQLGVGYSSNNAGDGPWTQSVVSDEAMDFAESALCLAFGLIKANNKSDYILALINFAKTRKQGSLLKNNVSIDRCMSYISHLFNKTEVELQSDNVFSDLRGKLKDFDIIRKSDLFKKFYKLFMYVISFSLFGDENLTYDRFGYTVLEQELIKKQHSSKTDFIYTILDTVTFICEKGYQIYKTGEVSNIFHESKRYGEWYDKSQALQRASNFVDTDPDFQLSQFLADLDETIEQGNSIMRFGVTMGKYEKDTIGTYLNNLKMIKANFLTKSKAREMRDPPFALLIHGETGIGKSLLKDVFRICYANVRNLNKHTDYCYTRNPASKFWDGFNTAQWACVLDDIAFMNVNAAPTGDLSCLEFIQILNPTPFCPDQASLELKGTTPFLCELVIGTTNTKHLNSFYYFSCPSAVQRRFPIIITPTVRPEYCQPGNQMLDYSKVPELVDDYPDYWTFKIETIVPAPLKDAGKQTLGVFKTIHENIDVYETMDFIVGAIKEHRKKCVIVKNSVNTMCEIEFCKVCYRSQKKCKCLQSLIVPQNFVLYFLQFAINTIINFFCMNVGFYLVYWIIDLLHWWPVIQHNIRVRVVIDLFHTSYVQ